MTCGPAGSLAAPRGPLDLFGGAITSDLARILFALAPDGIELLDSIIRNRALNEYVRGEATQVFCLLVRDACLPREEAVERLTRHLRDAIDGEDVEIATKRVSTLRRAAWRTAGIVHAASPAQRSLPVRQREEAQEVLRAAGHR